MKSRLGQAPLPAMEFALAGQQSFAEQTLGPLQRQAFHEILAVGHQNVFDKIRMIEEERFLRAQLEIRNVAVLLREVLKKRQRPAPVSQQPSQWDPPPRTWR